MTFLRFLILLTLAVWLGALIFFPFVAQTSFSSLPSDQAGQVVRGSLMDLHSIGLTCGVIFRLCSVVYNRTLLGHWRVFAAAHVFVLLMIALTESSQFVIIPKMDTLRISAGEIDILSASDPIRVQFDSLHAWSVRTEGTVLVLGLIVLYSVARRFSSFRT
ncbi:MAG TPA: DUF4149 domain-containing protein [Terriglobales bacterium]|nr:DUF4149 domain-containing protein [Terriglobales bacterium]